MDTHILNEDLMRRAIALARTQAARGGGPFGAVVARIHAEIARPPAERALPMVRMLAGEGQAPFAAWVANPDKVLY